MRRPDPVELVVDGDVVPAFPGESLAAALLAAGRWMLAAATRKVVIQGG